MNCIKFIVDINVSLKRKLHRETFWRHLIGKIETWTYIAPDHAHFVALPEACARGHCGFVFIVREICFSGFENKLFQIKMTEIQNLGTSRKFRDKFSFTHVNRFFIDYFINRSLSIHQINYLLSFHLTWNPSHKNTNSSTMNQPSESRKSKDLPIKKSKILASNTT